MAITVTRFSPRVDRGLVSVETTPVAGDVLVDGVRWGRTPLYGEFAAGSYAMSFGAVSGYEAPRSERVRVAGGTLSRVTAEYRRVERVPTPTPPEERRVRPTFF